MTLDTPVMRPAGARADRRRVIPFVLAGILLALVYGAASTWSIGQGFGGYGADGGWIDFDGNPTETAPVEVNVVGHPAVWVISVLAGLLLLAAIWTNLGEPRVRRRRVIIGCTTAAAFLVAVVLVFTVLQMRLIEDAFAEGDPHPPILGNATVTTSRLPPG